MAKRMIVHESESDSGSDNLDESPRKSTTSQSQAPSSKTKKKKALNDHSGSTFGVARDPTPETPTEDLSSSSEEEQADAPVAAKKRKRRSPPPPARRAQAKASSEKDASDDKGKQSKFFKEGKEKKQQGKPKAASAFGVGHESSSSSSNSLNDAASADEHSELTEDEEEEEEDPQPRKSKKTKSPNKKSKEPASTHFQVKLGPPQNVPKGHIAKSTMQFLQALQLETCNDREWFAFHDAQYRHAWQQWLDFVASTFTPALQQADPEIPELPPKDVVHRIYRDVRFSSDKRPYKTVLTASTSRGGRKAQGFASYYIQVGGGRSLMAAGIWCPDKNDIATIRHNMTHNDVGLFRQVIEAPSFVDMFGPAEPLPRPQKAKKPRKKKPKKGSDVDTDQEEEQKAKEPSPEPEPSRRQNIFGHEDELVNAPKGVAKDHPLIDLLRLRTIAVSRSFSDKEVQAPDFFDKLRHTAAEMAPFVHILNDMLIPNGLQAAEDATASS